MLLRSVFAVFVLPCTSFREAGLGEDVLSYPEISSREQSMMETGVEYIHNQSAATSVTKKDINEMVLEAVSRACIGQMARAYDQILTENKKWLNSTVPEICFTEEGKNELECKRVDEILEHVWNTEDEIAHKKTKSLIHRLKNLDEMVVRHGFDRVGAARHCKQHAAEPRPEAVKDCMLEKITEGKTAKSSWKTRLSPESLTLRKEFRDEKNASNLQGLVEKRFAIRQKLDILNKAYKSKHRVLAKGIKSINKELNEDETSVKKAIKRTKFSYHHTYKQCLNKCKIDTFSDSSSLLKRITQDLNGAVEYTGGKCHEKEEVYCPEGTAADYRRGFDPYKFASVWASVFAVYKPTAMAIGGVAGFLIGGPVAATAFMAAAAVPGPGFVVPLPIAAAAASDWFPSCRCFPLECKFDDELGYCMMEASTATKNPFARLPHPGMRCVLTGHVKKKCELAPCTQAHYDMELPGYPAGNISGMVGNQPGTLNVNNCLRVNDRDVPQPLLSAVTIPGDADGHRWPNWASSRTKLYEKLGVSFGTMAAIQGLPAK